MDEHLLIMVLLFSALFLGVIAIVQTFSKKWSFPYTVALLLTGFLGQILVSTLHLDVHLELHPDIIFFILLPILLFEAAMHINFHQFRLQFKTISFLSTFGLLVSIFVIGFLLSLVTGVPLQVALLFGAIISATDPIAVLSLFKTLGAPRRLSLLADGESMFNDATGVIAFKLVSTFVVADSVFQAPHLFRSLGDFLYVFTGSMVFGIAVGYIAARLIALVKHDRVVVASITAALGLGSFVVGEHFFHVSGVIATVMAGITLGNMARTKIAYKVNHFLEEFWEYLGFVALSLVFFFAAYNLDFSIFANEPMTLIFAVIAVLVGRAVSVYVSAFLSNRLSFFKDEPNIPASWQHILNWGGLRGVIPLVLAYSLPETFAYREELLALTLAALLFTLIVNGLTIKSLLLKLKLHLPKKEERIVLDEEKIFSIEETLRHLAELPKDEFSSEAVHELHEELKLQEQKLKQDLLKITKEEEFLTSLRLQALSIERDTVTEMYHRGYINENIYYDFDAELDLQQDALEYPEVFTGRGIEAGGKVTSAKSYRQRLKGVQSLLTQFSLFKDWLSKSKEELVEERYGLLRARITSSERVLDYLERVERIFTNHMGQRVVAQVRSEQEKLIRHNKERAVEMEKNHNGMIVRFQKEILKSSLGLIGDSNAH